MNRRQLSLLALSATVLLGAIASLAFLPDSVNRADPERGSAGVGSDDIPEDLHEPEPRDPVRIAPSPGPPNLAREDQIQVVSSAGIPLDVVELETSSGLWVPFRRTGSGPVQLPGVALGHRVRSPGHLPRMAANRERVLVLEPESLLELSLPGDARWLDIRPGPRFREHLEGFSATRTLDNRFSMAVEASLLQAHPAVSNPIPVVGVLDSGWRVRVEWNARPGDRIHEELPGIVANRRSRAVLTVVPDGVPSSASIHWTIHSLNRFDPATRQFREQSLPSIARPWGSVAFHEDTSTEGPRERTSTGGAPVHFEGAFLGAAYLVGAVEEAGRLVGRAVFRFEGDPEHVLLRACGRPYRVRLLEAETHAPLAGTEVQARFLYGGPGCEEHACLWNSSGKLEADQDGFAELRGIANVPGDPLLAWPPPEQGDLVLRVPGYREVRLRVAWNPGPDGVCELGEVLFHARPPSFSIAGVPDVSAWRGPAELNDEDTSVVVTAGETPEALLGIWAPPSSIEVAGSSSLVLRQDFRLLGIERTAGGWKAIASHEYHVSVELPHTDGVLVLGCAWRGVRVELALEAALRDRLVELDLRGPPGLEFFIEPASTEPGMALSRSWTLTPGHNEVQF